jgi:heme/copper-type cytochrome/quinol oxidase subunit 2
VLGLAVGGLLPGLALTGCTNPPASTATPTPAVTSESPSPSAPTSAGASPSASPTPAPSETTAANSLTIDITIAGGQVTPNGKKINVELGQTIVLNVTSDEHDEIHAHTEGDGYELEVAPGKQATGEFELNSPGSYEVESHHLGKTIVILNAR